MMVLVTGSSGKLGGELLRALRLARHPAVGLDLPELDVTDSAAVEQALAAHAPGAVLHCAAFTDVDAAEGREEEALAVNRDGAANVARAAAAGGAWLLHVSTDFVFRGDLRRAYREDDAPGPLSAYGRTKRAGEAAVLRAHPGALVLRTAWLYGGGGPDFVRKVLARARSGAPLSVVEDQVGSPTWARDLAEAMVGLLAPRPAGILHFANAGACSRYELAAAALEEAGVRAALRPCRTADLPPCAPRPPFAPLEASRYAALSGSPPRGWRAALRAFLAEELRTGVGA